jgi:hypothetical protein
LFYAEAGEKIDVDGGSPFCVSSAKAVKLFSFRFAPTRHELSSSLSKCQQYWAILAQEKQAALMC